MNDYKQYLIDKKGEIRDIINEGIVKREERAGKDKTFIHSIIGPRRAGKTYFLYNLISDMNLDDSEYAFVNFEDDTVKGLERRKVVRIVDYHTEIYGKRPRFLFLDEIQELERWSSFLYSLHESKRYVIYATGSSSRLLSMELSTSLRGRSMSIIIFPFSFREFASYKKVAFRNPMESSEISKTKKLLREYTFHGGFPQVVIGNAGNEFFRQYVDTVIYKDIVERFRIENIDAMRFIIMSLIQSNTKEFSVNKIYRQLKAIEKVGKNTLYTYLSHISKSFFSMLLRKFDWSMKRAMLTIPKAYLADPGIYTSYMGQNIGVSMENIVFIELKKMEMKGVCRIWYFKSREGYEVDFVISKEGKIKELVNVTHASSFDEIEHREIRALLKASELLKCKNLIVITWDYEDEKRVEWFGRKGNIRFVPLWKWLMEKSHCNQNRQN